MIHDQGKFIIVVNAVNSHFYCVCLHDLSDFPADQSYRPIFNGSENIVINDDVTWVAHLPSDEREMCGFILENESSLNIIMQSLLEHEKCN